jgi:N-acetylmuramoyl-L-alanine amidase
MTYKNHEVMKMVKVFIDPGHGGSDSGAVGNGLSEKNVTLSIATRIRDILQNEYPNAVVKMSRTGDQTVTLKQRTDMANAWGADFYLSIHINAGGGTGYEDYIYNRLSDRSRTADIQRVIHQEVMKLVGLSDRGAKKADFHVIRESAMDAMLTENGFIDNANDAAKMKDANWIENVARGHVNGIARVYSLQRSGNSVPTPAPTPTATPPAPAAPATRKRTLYLPADADTWRVYPLNVTPIKQNALPTRLRPSKFGGLQYEILGETQPHVYIIQTDQLGRVQIYAGPGTGAVVK